MTALTPLFPRRVVPSFARPPFADVVRALDVVLTKDYPARGEVVDLAEAE